MTLILFTMYLTFYPTTLRFFPMTLRLFSTSLTFPLCNAASAENPTEGFATPEQKGTKKTESCLSVTNNIKLLKVLYNYAKLFT